MNLFFRQYWQSVLFTCLILFLSFMNPVKFKEIPTFHLQDKLVHLILYFVYGYILIRDLHKGQVKTNIQLIVQTMIFPIALGGLIEYLQVTFFPPRTAEWLDWIADALGILLVWLIFAYKGKKILLLK